MKHLQTFLRDHPPAPIVSPERLEKLLRVVKGRVQSGIMQMEQRGEPRETDRAKTARSRRFHSLMLAMEKLTEADRRLLSDALAMEEIRRTGSEEIRLRTSLTQEADEVFSRLEWSLKWLTEDRDRRRYNAHLRNMFIQSAAALFVGYGFETIGGNSNPAPNKADVFQQFVIAILKESGLPENEDKRPSPFNVKEFSVTSIGETEQDRAAWVEEYKLFLTT